MIFAERFRKDVEKMEFIPANEEERHPITVSGGISSFPLAEEIEERIRILLSQSNIIKQQQQTTQVISACDKSIQMQKEIELDYTMINNASRLSWDDYYQLYKNRYQFVYRVETDKWEYIGDIKIQYCVFRVC